MSGSSINNSATAGYPPVKELGYPIYSVGLGGAPEKGDADGSPWVATKANKVATVVGIHFCLLPVGEFGILVDHPY